MIFLLLADGFEEVEALAPLDLLRRAGAEIRTVGIGTDAPIGSHGIKIFCDLTEKEADPTAADMLILPGGMPGAKNLDASDFVDKAIAAVASKGGHLAAICAAPMVLGRRGLLRGKNAVCYPGFEEELEGACVKTTADVVTDGNITTAKGAGVAFDFGLALVSLLFGEEKAAALKKATMHPQGNARFLNFEKAEGGEAADALFPLAFLANGQSSEDDDLEETKETYEKLSKIFSDFHIDASIKEVHRGPRFTRYTVVPGKGVFLSTLTKHADDFSTLLGMPLRIKALPDESAVGYEIPNARPQVVRLRKILESEAFLSHKSKTAVCIGADVKYQPIIADIAKMPHALVAGATGMGKSVFIHAMLASLLCKARPDEVKLILIDTKMVEFNAYNGIAHLLVPVITDAKAAIGALHYALDEMERRYEQIMAAEVRSIDAYNEKVKENPALGKPMPKIIIVIDELNDLMMQEKEATENLIMVLAQKARAAGIHLMIGTQRPSVNVITGIIKANIPTRICFKVASAVDSRTVLEQNGAENLLDKGDMLFHPVGAPEPIRVQGAFVSDNEITDITDFLKSQSKGAAYNEDAIEAIRRAAEAVKEKPIEDEESEEEYNLFADEKFLAAADLATANEKVSTALLQRKLSIGYSKACFYLDALEEIGIVSEPNGSRPRDVLMSAEEWEEIKKGKI